MSKIFICDSIMGSGKTSAAIRMMNEESDRRSTSIQERFLTLSRRGMY